MNSREGKGPSVILGPFSFLVRQIMKGEKDMVEYLKIETPFNRDMEGTKKLIEGDWRNETVGF